MTLLCVAVSAAESEARKASEAKAKADAEADDAVRLLAIAKKDKVDLEAQVEALNNQISRFEESAAVLEGQVRKRDETIAELREQISKLEGAAGSEADEAKKECERLKVALKDKDAEAQSKDKELCKLRDELAAEKLAREAETSASNGKINGLEKELGDLREQLKGYDGADKESLARLCRIRELEEEVRREMAESAQIAGQRDALRSEVKSANELKAQAVRDLGLEKAKFDGEKRAWQSREAALKSEIEALSLNLNKGPAKEIKQEVKSAPQLCPRVSLYPHEESDHDSWSIRNKQYHFLSSFSVQIHTELFALLISVCLPFCLSLPPPSHPPTLPPFPGTRPCQEEA